MSFNPPGALTSDGWNSFNEEFHLKAPIRYWFDNDFKKHYSEKKGAPAKPIRLMVSLLILKYVRNLSDENLIECTTPQSLDSQSGFLN